MITLEKLNVVKEVASEREAKRLEALGYKRVVSSAEDVKVKETEKEDTTEKGGATSGKGAKKSSSKTAEKEDK